jgi:IclR family transcriptional regulator, pca regulon regulatory protein
MNQAGRGGSLRRGLALLTCLGEAGRPLGLSELASAAGLDKATTYRLAQTLVDSGYLTQDAATRSYSLALTILDLGFAALARMDVRALALPYMRALADRFDGASVSLGVLDGADVVYIERISQRRISVNVDVQVGSRLSAHCSSMGKALLAALPAADARAAILLRPLARMTPSTITSVDVLEAELRRIAGAGYATNDEETVRGLRSLAAAVRGADGRPAAAINVAVSAAETSMDELVAAASGAVVDAAARISRHLGQRGETDEPEGRERETG